MIDPTKPMTDQTAGDLRALIDALHGNRERYDRLSRIVEARSCELEIAEATRALAIVNRRATEAEDQRAAEERDDIAVLRAFIRAATELGSYPDPADGARACPIPARWVAMLDRLTQSEALREADIREAFLAGAVWMSERTELGDGGAGFHVIEPSQGKTDDASAEYARSKAGG